ncbi:hypothetical protein [Nocardia sp. NPDC052566]|uniref:hypothetical protein n=1 Tax=Nocardia sp. NPDC052566 TaxID=3364330 RepID=UPI0037C7BC24
MTTTLNPSIIGQVEKAHTALLLRALGGTGVDEKQWITLNVAAGEAVERAELVARVTHATQVDAALIDAAVTALLAAELLTPLDSGVAVTDSGHALIGKVRGTTGSVVGRAYGDIPEADLATAARVLSVITERMRDELTRL